MPSRSDTHLLTDRGSNILFLHMNTQKPPLDDLNCRLALTYAFDYATAIKLAQITDKVSAASPASGPIGRSEFGFNASLPMFAQDIGKAKDYLAKCKYKTPDERKIDITWITEVPAEEKIALLMKANFDQLGFQTTIKGAPWTLYTQQVSKVDSTPSLSEVYIDAPTPDPELDPLQHVQFQVASDLGVGVPSRRSRSRQAARRRKGGDRYREAKGDL